LKTTDAKKGSYLGASADSERCEAECKEDDECQFHAMHTKTGIPSATYTCYNCISDIPLSEDEQTCRSMCFDEDRCIEESVEMLTGVNNDFRCVVRCTYRHLETTDYRIETVTKNRAWNVFVREGDEWKQLDCYNDYSIYVYGNKKVLENNDDYLKDSFTETLKKCSETAW